MFKNYFKTAWRTIFQHKAFSTINILGLASGLACSVLILLWVQDEKSVDSFNTNSKYLYQVYERTTFEGRADGSYLTQGLLAQELQRSIAGIQYASGLEQDHTFNFKAGDKTGKMDGSFADSNFFRMFSYQLLQGDAANALTAPGSIAISRNMANVFFGSPARAVGQTIRFEDAIDLHVTAVFENIPNNSSSQQFEFLRCWKDYLQENNWATNWGNSSPYTLVQLRPNADPAKVAAEIKDFIYRYKPKEAGTVTELGLQLYTDKYLHSVFTDGRPVDGRIAYVRLFSIVAVFILLLACINFINLATARSAKRAKEVGVRKVVGALRVWLIMQFTGEALLLTLLSLTIAIGLAVLALPAFNSITGKHLILPVAQPAFWVALASLLAITGIVAGSYPAVFLSSLNPVKVLKGGLKFSSRSAAFRKGLVVFQFTLSVMLILGMMITFKQMTYIQTKNLGYNRENLLYIPLEGEMVKKFELFKAEAGKLPGITAMAKMREAPTVITHSVGGVAWQGQQPNDPGNFSDATAGYDFVKTLNLKLVAGRDFSREYNDSANYLVNEAAAAKMGYKNAVGQPLTFNGTQGTIIGVLKDFHFSSMHDNIQPLIVRFAGNLRFGTVLVRTRAGQTREALSGLEKVFKKLNPNYPFTYQFSDQEYAKLYKSEEVVSKLAGIFASLAIFISCLGLFGLATFTAEQRTKEIGVRKVLGASISNIFGMLSASFLQPVMLSLLIGLPLAYYIMGQWLNTFAYKISIEWWMFAAAGLTTAVIALLTVSYQSLRAAVRNPVRSLRTE